MADQSNFKQNSNVLTDQNDVPVQNGTVPQDNGAKNTALQVDALGTQNVDITFEKGNYNQIKAFPQAASTKINALTKTLVPLIEVALIELTGSSQKYKRTFAQVSLSIDENTNLSVEFNIQYSIPDYIGTDFEYNDLQADSKYIYDRITPAGIAITKCEINTADGIVTIMGNF